MRGGELRIVLFKLPGLGGGTLELDEGDGLELFSDLVDLVIDGALVEGGCGIGAENIVNLEALPGHIQSSFFVHGIFV